MKKQISMLFCVAFIIGLLSVPIMTLGGTIQIIKSEGNDNKELDFPRRTPVHYSNLASAVWDAETGELSVSFNADADETTIFIYKDGELVAETVRSISTGDIVVFDLSVCGDGEYQIVISSLGDDDLYGNF